MLEQLLDLPRGGLALKKHLSQIMFKLLELVPYVMDISIKRGGCTCYTAHQVMPRKITSCTSRSAGALRRWTSPEISLIFLDAHGTI